ncbi:MAG: hypothetical protein PVJ67_02035 [Candidatus Pacearchaeota archaeon]|jgi:hypothetical protein
MTKNRNLKLEKIAKCAGALLVNGIMYSLYSLTTIFNSSFRDTQDLERGMDESYQAISEKFENIRGRSY